MSALGEFFGNLYHLNAEEEPERRTGLILEKMNHGKHKWRTVSLRLRSVKRP
jgi:hypothetical protein